MQTETFIRKSFPVEAIRVTADNIEEIARWCGGDILKTDKDEKFIKVKVNNPQTERQTRAFLGDWILEANKGYKVYTEKAFNHAFEHSPKAEAVPVLSDVGSVPTANSNI